MRFIVDHIGNLVQATGSSGAARTDRLLENEGCVLIEQRRGRYIISLNGARIQPVTEAALYYFMAGSGSAQFVVSFLPDLSPVRIYASRGAAIKAIADEISQHRRGHASRFAFRPMDIASLSSSPHLQLLLDNFAAVMRAQGLAGMRDYLACLRHDRYLIVEHRPRAGTLVIQEVGSGYAAFDPGWSRRAAGRVIEEQADVHYGRWLEQTYGQVLALGQPAAQEVDAAIFRPGYGRRRFAYRRLLLPFTGVGEQQCLLSVSVLDPAIDLGIN